MPVNLDKEKPYASRLTETGSIEPHINAAQINLDITRSGIDLLKADEIRLTRMGFASFFKLEQLSVGDGNLLNVNFQLSGNVGRYMTGLIAHLHRDPNDHEGRIGTAKPSMNLLLYEPGAADAESPTEPRTIATMQWRGDEGKLILKIPTGQDLTEYKYKVESDGSVKSMFDYPDLPEYPADPNDSSGYDAATKLEIAAFESQHANEVLDGRKKAMRVFTETFPIMGNTLKIIRRRAAELRAEAEKPRIVK